MIKTANLTASISRQAGGLFESVRRLVQSLSELGMDVRVLSACDRFTAADAAAWQPVRAIAFKPVWSSQFAYSPFFLRALAEFAPDLVHTHGLWLYPSIATTRYSRRTKCPYVVSPHGMLDPWAIRHAGWKKAMARFLYEHSHCEGAACLRALCQAEAAGLRQAGFRKPIAVVPNGIDLPAIARTPFQPNPLWQEAIPKQSKLLLFLGRIHPKKGLINLVKAWKQVRSQRSVPGTNAGEWVLAIAGWDQGNHEADLRQLADELELGWADLSKPRPQSPGSGPGKFSKSSRPDRSLLFLGPQFGDAKLATYRWCDAVVLPSFSEGLPMAILEGWAFGKPALITPECNLPEGFAEGAAMRIETTVDSIAAGLKQLLSSSDAALQGMGRAGQLLVARRFAWSNVGAEMKEVYQWVLGGGSKPGHIL